MIKHERSSFSWYNSSLSFLFCRERLELVVSPNYSLRSLSFHGGGGGRGWGGGRASISYTKQFSEHCKFFELLRK